MRRGFVLGVAAGALLSLALGASIAILPTTPTWTLLRIKLALDDRDVDALTEMVDFPAVTRRAIDELGEGGTGGLDLGQAAMALLSGGKITTAFNDPEHPLRLSAGDVLHAWWTMRREGDLAYLSIPTGDRPVDLVLGRARNMRWRIVGVTPISALIKVKSAPKEERRSTRSLAPRGVAGSERVLARRGVVDATDGDG